MKKITNVSAALIGLTFLSGCITLGHAITSEDVPGQPAAVMYSSPVSDHVTPLNSVLICLGQALANRPVSVAVGDVRDYTGKSTSDDGMAVTQGAALMAYSALGKMQPGVQIHERFDTRIADAELAYIKNRQLGDGAMHEVPGSDAEIDAEVPWKPYFGGTVLQSDYYIVGGITELNYNIRTRGAEAQVNQVGPKAREYVMNIAVDLRIVGTQSLRVYKTATIQKQLVGYEVGFDVFRFLNSDLLDFNAGAKSQEPLQLGVRMAVEEGVIQLISAVAKVDASKCRNDTKDTLQKVRTK